MSVGVALGGNFVFAPPPFVQIAAASSVVAELKNFLPNMLSTLPHKRSPGAATKCPGIEGLENWLKVISGQSKWI